MSVAPADRTLANLPLSLIDPPELDVRLDRDPDKLEELSRDLLRRGLIEPLKVVRVGGRFELIDGHRRFLAAQMAGLVGAECFVYPTKEAALQGVKYAANAYREDMSPAEEAKFFLELYQGECEFDLERVAAMVGKKLAYVQNRIALLEGDDEVFAAVRDRRIALGVAAELNKVPDEGWRRYYLGHAIRSGAVVAVVAQWVVDWRNTHAGPVAPVDQCAAAPVTVSGPVYDPHRCEVCGKSDPRFIPEQVSIHTHCKIAILEPMLAAYHGQA